MSPCCLRSFRSLRSPLSLGPVLAAIARHAVPALLLLFALLAPSAWAFEVIKDVNSGEPKEKLVIFEKGKPTDHLVFIDEAHCKFGFAEDGSLECLITGNAEANPRIGWKGAGLPESFDVLAHDYLILTFRVEGNHKVKRGEKMVDMRAGNMWVPVALYDSAGEVVGSANLADPTPDQITPESTVTLRFPKSLLTYWGPGKGQVSAVGFKWSKASPDTERNYRIVIEKIVLADS